MPALREGVRAIRLFASAVPAPIAALIACAAISVIAGAWTIGREYHTRQSEKRFQDQTTLLHSPEDARAVAIATPGVPTARLLATDALFLARQAAYLPPGRRREAMLMRAQRLSLAARQERPHWGEGWVIAAFVASLRSPTDHEQERRALIRSYADAPFLEQSGYWRVERTIAHWDAMPPSTRNRMIDEAAWLLLRGEVENRTRLFGIVRASPAYRPAFMRWYALRQQGN